MISHGERATEAIFLERRSKCPAADVVLRFLAHKGRANFLSAVGRLARRPKYKRAIRKLLDKSYLGALQGAQKELKKFAMKGRPESRSLQWGLDLAILNEVRVHRAHQHTQGYIHIYIQIYIYYLTQLYNSILFLQPEHRVVLGLVQAAVREA